MTLSGVYGFWKFVSKLHREESRRYLEMFYILKFRELVRGRGFSTTFAKIVVTVLLEKYW